ncbi:MAG TPA: phosphate-starvation-inducible PsiE family protein, partial [Methanoregula sp.]|nr:phosphate-starvation-inducible PsiE family protein [Methanoregula sp.]
NGTGPYTGGRWCVMIEIINKFEKVIYAMLIIMLMGVLLAAVLDLAWILVVSLIQISPWLLETHEMISVLGGFLLVLIGVELLDTIKAYFRENAIHVEIVVLLAIIAVARKVILLDPTGMSGTDYGVELIGTGVIIVGLAAGYYLIKKAGITIGPAEHGQDKSE